MTWPPMPQSETPPKGHFSSRQPQSWDQQRPHINVRKFNVSSVHCCSPTHFALRTDFLQALCVSGNPAWNTLKSLERTGKKEESPLWEKKRQTRYRIWWRGWFLPVVKVLLCLKCPCGHGSSIPLTWAGALLVSYINRPKFVITHLY